MAGASKPYATWTAPAADARCNGPLRRLELFRETSCGPGVLFWTGCPAIVKAPPLQGNHSGPSLVLPAIAVAPILGVTIRMVRNWKRANLKPTLAAPRWRPS